MLRSLPPRTHARAATAQPTGRATERSRVRRIAPSLLSLLRAASAPLLAVALIDARWGAALALSGFAAASDVLDGWLARRWGVARAGGAWLDACADLAVVLAGFWALAWVGALPGWLPLLIAAMFAQFALSSVHGPARGTPRYDPVGRGYGGVLLAGLALVAAAPDAALLAALPGALLGLSLVSLASRAATFAARRKETR